MALPSESTVIKGSDFISTFNSDFVTSSSTIELEFVDNLELFIESANFIIKQHKKAFFKSQIV